MRKGAFGGSKKVRAKSHAYPCLYQWSNRSALTESALVFPLMWLKGGADIAGVKNPAIGGV